MIARIRYRLTQFLRARHEVPGTDGLARARQTLSPPLYELFSRMLPFEQAHAIRVMDGLAAEGWEDPDLLAAALLHDVGKVRWPLHPWERALAVAIGWLAPELCLRWGKGEASGWRAGIVVAVQHPVWGAEMAAAAGANDKVVWLIGHHQDDVLLEYSGRHSAELKALQLIDHNN